ncbi:hypothetical protein KKC44_04555 [Patescibacteria group bacterium]|nr:hypothetical protein [Patescibacteria group bacterium]
MNCKQNMVASVLTAVMVGTLLSAGANQLAQLVARRQGVESISAGVHYTAPNFARVYRNSRSVRLSVEEGVSDEILRSAAEVVDPDDMLQRKSQGGATSSFVNTRVPSKCRGLVGGSLGRCIQRIGGTLE